MSSVVISGDSSGTVTLTVPSAAGTNTATLPAATGTVMVSGNMPAFAAYANTNQALTQNTFTKVTFGTEVFDTNNNFASSRFTPTVAGYYQLNTAINFGGNATATYGLVSFYKNGTEYARQSVVSATTVNNLTGSTLVYLNGSTDYVEVYVYSTQTNISLFGDGTGSYTTFSGSLVRSA